MLINRQLYVNKIMYLSYAGNLTRLAKVTEVLTPKDCDMSILHEMDTERGGSTADLTEVLTPKDCDMSILHEMNTESRGSTADLTAVLTLKDCDMSILHEMDTESRGSTVDLITVPTPKNLNPTEALNHYLATRDLMNPTRLHVCCKLDKNTK